MPIVMQTGVLVHYNQTMSHLTSCHMWWIANFLENKETRTVSHSYAESEYRSVAVTRSELTWLRALLGSLGVFHDFAKHLFCDNQAALRIAKMINK